VRERMEKEILIGDYLKNVREGKNKRSLQSISDASKILYPDDKERQISASYLMRVEDGSVDEVSPKKLMTLAQIYDENYYYLLYLAGYIDENPQDISVSNEMLLQKSIDIDKLLSDPKIKVHFSGNPIDDDKKQAIISILTILTKKV
jgi:transcriptional regulator with XRE-family HTH domain